MRRLFTFRGWIALGLLTGAGGLFAAGQALPPVALVNESASLPRGLYLRQVAARPDRGVVAAAAQPPSARAYLSALGAPADMMLIKRVAAVGGDHVCRDHARVFTPIVSGPVTVYDRRGARLPTWRACRRLEADEVFLMGDTATSFDSRYFGPLQRSELRGVYRAVLTW